MEAISVEIVNPKAKKLLQDLVELNLIQVVVNEREIVPSSQKLSERFAGCLSGERTNELQKELLQMRNELEI
ncbi:hypothetical protein AGMMS49965_07680 [Bacteroidia bacterium]|nr:hypothetical protein AGMMS49965_07680 [Bacteroidia bacterium]